MKKIWSNYSYAIILIVISCISALCLSFKSDMQSDKKYIKVTVEQGDTLWEIANNYTSGSSLSGDQFVSWVKLHNQINGDQIFPGQKIVVPIPKDLSTADEFATASGK
ncbi:MAG: LysM peptidoglycan-binding domain-containing protein [Bacillota bacterium]|nr:LysM peptidoglycan-binding domain-containing protein [Bacillota bacterium]